MIERKVVVRLADGLHARPATQFVKLARTFASTLSVVKDAKIADAKSSVKLMLLSVKQDEEVVLRADGADEAEALTTLGDFVSRTVGEGGTQDAPHILASPRRDSPSSLRRTATRCAAWRRAKASRLGRRFFIFPRA